MFDKIAFPIYFILRYLVCKNFQQSMWIFQLQWFFCGANNFVFWVWVFGEISLLMYFIFAFLAGKIFSCNLHGEDIITEITFWIYHTNLSKDQGMARVSIGVWQDILSESLFWTTHMNLSKVFFKENLTLLFSFLLFLGTRLFRYLKNGEEGGK